MTNRIEQFEQEQSAAFGGPAISAWPAGKGQRMRPHKGGGDPGAAAREQEADRQARIKAATESINAIFNNQVPTTETRYVNPDGRILTPQQYQAQKNTMFGLAKPETYTTWAPGNPANDRQLMYDQQRDAVYELNSQDVNRQAQEAERANRFGMARAGLLGGSVDVDSNADIQRRTNEGLMRAGGIADQASADLLAADERTRGNLISLAQSGIDSTTAAQQALQGLKVNAANAASARAGATVGGLFNDMGQAYLIHQQRKGWDAGMNGQPGQQWYGVSNPSQGDSGSVTR